ncbi:MAG: hypothetical protein FWB96_06780 [Defluviitaleaceae bacterium]|nr:hypothetical protein [Defluviitaleaceae bacterium]MCL2262601.1 hypothetical protein [Defluviitaleaceae bacterium]
MSILSENFVMSTNILVDFGIYLQQKNCLVLTVIFVSFFQMRFLCTHLVLLRFLEAEELTAETWFTPIA